MSTKKENIKVGVSVAHSAGSSRRFDQANRHSLLSQIVSILSVILRKQEGLKELLENVSVPASLLLFLTVPILLLSISGGSLVIFWFAIPVILSGVAWGLLLLRHRAKEPQPFLSIITQLPPGADQIQKSGHSRK